MLLYSGGIDDKPVQFAISYRVDRPPNSPLAITVDNGPVARAANDNNARARTKGQSKTVRSPIKEMFEQGELGVNEIENQRHWMAAKQFKTLLDTALNETSAATAMTEWRELMMPFFENLKADFISSESTDVGLSLDDDLEFSDTLTLEAGSSVDFACWDVFRDLPPAVEIMQAKQTLALANNVLGDEIRILRAAIGQGWTARMLGETEGFTARASASACGKGMLRRALRNLSRFFVGLQRMEWGLEGPKQIWPLVGTTAWIFADLLDKPPPEPCIALLAA